MGCPWAEKYVKLMHLFCHELAHIYEKIKIVTEKKVKGQRHSVQENNHIHGETFKVISIQRKVNEKWKDCLMPIDLET